VVAFADVADVFVEFLLQLRGALGTLMTEGAVVIHGDNVKRV
jgi:hypothetical protein